ncbi:UPF0271 protein [Aequitasia blattaphilus]|uniref:5-oxoprolinase subunit A n=1 Tax=Aequitasia blattaphilus TaxID=2949332 RepID=A0ABT1E8Y2_9FIRM|nr:5-oxoprolinase subunit PxpA [Aequitasia blattaphilus]MCP1100972.1 5-oxoprolinase subunit PxpA [Aequitasia blattaphilus]MCR8613612.1 5-oxoprolinase subunit PxpA [Aequitasia blattaphilus]
MAVVDLNSDLGESFGNYTCGQDSELISLISSANIACGFHASDPLVMMNTVREAREKGIGIGAHPGFPDLVGFGRRNMEVSQRELKAMVLYQIGALQAFCHENKVKLAHVKPHGAMYNMAGKNPEMARTICEAIGELDKSLILLAPSGSEMEKAAKEIGMPFAKEVFADRAYEDDGSLVPRGRTGAMIEDEDEMIRRVITMIKSGKVETISGKEISIQADSVCVHGDGKAALKFTARIRKELVAAGIEIKSLKDII